MPWLEGCTPQGRDSQHQWRQQQQLRKELLPPGLTIPAPVAQTPPANANTVSKCGVSRGYDDVRPKKRVIVDVMKLKRLDVRTV